MSELGAYVESLSWSVPRPARGAGRNNNPGEVGTGCCKFIVRSPSKSSKADYTILEEN